MAFLLRADVQGVKVLGAKGEKSSLLLSQSTFSSNLFQGNPVHGVAYCNAVVALATSLPAVCLPGSPLHGCAILAPARGARAVRATPVGVFAVLFLAVCLPGSPPIGYAIRAPARLAQAVCACPFAASEGHPRHSSKRSSAACTRVNRVHRTTGSCTSSSVGLFGPFVELQDHSGFSRKC